jgi:hypothetical protein
MVSDDGTFEVVKSKYIELAWVPSSSRLPENKTVSPLSILIFNCDLFPRKIAPPREKRLVDGEFVIAVLLIKLALLKIFIIGAIYVWPVTVVYIAPP